MATFNTRIQSKIDTYAQWMANDPILLKGELAIATIPAATGAVKQEPATLLKVGNGADKFSALPFISARAADVAAWALADTKPTYEAAEIVGLSDYISGEIQDSNTTYNLVQDGMDSHILILQKKEVGETEWTEVTRITTADSQYDSQIAENAAAISALSSLVGSSSVAEQIGTAIDALKLDETYEQKGAAAQALTEAKTYADNSAGAVKSELQTNINNLSGQVSANTSAIAVLNGTGDGSVDAKIDAAFNEFATNVTDDNVVNSYKELINYAAQHGSDFTALVGTVDENTKAIASNAAKISVNENSIGTNTQAIQTNAEAIAGLKELVGTTNVADQISSAIAAEKISETYATKADLNTTNNNVATAQSTASEAKTSASQANAAIAALHQVAATGDIDDLEQDADTYIIFNCGSSSDVI